MRYSLRKLVGSVLVLGVVTLAAPHAFADDISNNLDVAADAAPENMALTAGGPNGTTTLRVIAQNGDGKNGCNLTASSTLVVGVNNSNASIATVSPTSITFSSCGDLPTVTVTPLSAGSATISLSLTSNSTAGTFNLAPATFAAQVAPADSTPPTWSCTPAAADGVWHDADQSSNCTASDPSGLQAGSPATFSLSTNVAAGTETANASTNSQPLCDVRGNCTTAGPITGWKIDKKAPVVECIPSATDGVWHSTNQSASCTATDGGSGIAGAAIALLSTVVALGDESANASTGSHNFCDSLGHCTTAGPITGWMIDRQAPLATCVPPAADGAWHGSDQSSNCIASDTNGLDSSSPSSFALATNVAAGTQTSNASTNAQDLCDTLGNCTTVGPISGWMIDKQAPEYVCAPSDGLWHNDDIDINCTATDTNGLRADSPASFTLSTNVAAGTETSIASTGTRQLCDIFDNCTTAGPITGLKVDKNAPSFTCATADAQWHSDNQSSTCSATDGGSGVADSASATLTTSVAEGFENADASTNSHDFCDNVGNCTTAGPVTGWQIDRKAPSATCTPATADSAWHSFNQTVSCDATDGGSGIDGSADALLSTSVAEGVENANASTNSHDFCDNVGNCTTAGPVTGWKIDRKDPSATCTPADAIWHGSNQTSACTAVDGGSGIAGSATANVMTYVSDGDDDANAFTATHEFCDNVGNCAETTPVGGWMIDRKTPDATCVPPTADALWHGLDQSHACTATDTSGLAPGSPASFTLTTSVAAGSDDNNASTGSQLLCDIVGNCTTAGPIDGWHIDKKAPSFSCTPSDGLWHNANQTSSCSALDSGSGIVSPTATLHTDVADGADDANASTDSHQFCDNVGNCTTAGPVNGWKIDRKDPTNVAFTGSITNGASYYYSFVPANNMGCTAGDSGSGLATCNVTGYGQTVGTHTLTATATDAVGNSTTATLTYNVLAWTVDGFYQPVDMETGIWNTVKGGSTVPLKFNVFAGSSELTSTGVVKSFTATKVSCPNSAPEDAIEFVTTGGTTLRYDTTGRQFIQNWQTPKLAGACFKVTLSTQDGQSITAGFKLK